MNEKEIVVTGVRDFGTGARRDPNQDKGRYDLLSPLFLRRLARHTQKGGQARGDRNWENGMPFSAVLDSAIRHLFRYLEGDRSEDHLAAAAWNVMVLTHEEEMIERGLMHDELNDLPDYMAPEIKPMTATEITMKFQQYYPEDIEDGCHSCKYRSDIDGPSLIGTCAQCCRLSNWEADDDA